MQVPPYRDAHSVFSLKPAAVVPCGPAVTSPHLTMMSTTLTTISISSLRTSTLRPLCLRACLRLMSYTQPLVADSLWIFSRFRSNIPLHLIMSNCFMILSSPCIEHGCHTCLLTDALASSLRPRSLKGTHILSITVYGRNSWLHSVNSRRVDFHHSCTARCE